jgi:CO/xanthine dehydrogenase FAD-binding subunit
MTIIEYHRPKTIEEALRLLGRKDPKTIPLGGGTDIKHEENDALAVVDLQDLKLDSFESEDGKVRVGATLNLQTLQNLTMIPPIMAKVINLEASQNIRNIATLAGRMAYAQSRSALATLLMSMDAELTWEPGGTRISYGNWLATSNLHERGYSHNPGLLITNIEFPIRVSLAYHYVARSPGDLPIVCVSATKWNSGRLRIAMGGYGPAPILVTDGKDVKGVEKAAVSAYSQATDEWAGAKYRMELARILTRRCVEEIVEREPTDKEGA